MLDPLRLRSLETLRQSFQTAGQECGPLRCTLIEGGPKTRAKARFETPPGLYSKEHVVSAGGDNVFATGPSEPDKLVIRWYWYTSADQARGHAAIGRFNGLVNDLDRVFPYSIAALCLPESTLRSRGTRWLYTLFDLAWQRREGSPLAGDKRLWAGNTTFPWNPAGPNDFIGTWAYTAGGWPSNDVPDSFCSTLLDVFAASGQAIDVVLHELSTETERTRNPEGSQGRSMCERLVIRRSHDGSDHSVILDGRLIRVKGDAAIEFMEALASIAEEGQRVKAASLTAQCGQRADLVCRKLPKSLQEIIDKPGRGATGYGLKETSPVRR